LLVTVLVERSIAAGAGGVGLEAVAAVGAAPALALVPVGLSLFGAAAELLAPQDVAENGQTERPEDDEAQDHEADGQGRPLRFDDSGVGHFESILPVTNGCNVVPAGVGSRMCPSIFSS